MLEFDILSDRHDQGLARNKDIRLAGRMHTGSAAFDLADHLRGDIDTAHMVVFIDIDPGRSHQGFYFNALGNSAFNLAWKCSHISYTAPVEDRNLLCAETFCCSDCIHGNVAAANDSNLLSAQIRI